MLRQGLLQGAANPALRLVPVSVAVNRRAGITSKAMRKPRDVQPFPYEKIRYNSWRAMWDTTEDRLDENSRVIIVDGNVGVGKSTLAKKLAEDLDFLHFPEATLDMKFINDDGFDIRSIEDKMPEILRPFDLAKFYANPKSPMVADFQYNMLAIRAEQYIDALAHVLNTGQGVILERSPYSDFVFMEAMQKFGYVSRKDVEIYNEMRSNVLREFLRPHLIIYLDAPVEVLQQRIKQRGVPCEVNTNVLSADYLKFMDEKYKQVYLRSIKDESELLIYDWTKFGDPEVVVEDIERVPIEKGMSDIHEPKFTDWKQKNPREWDEIRFRVTSRKDIILSSNIWYVDRENIPELIAGGDAVTAYNEAFDKYYPKHSPAFDPAKGNSWLFRMDTNYRDHIRGVFRTR